MSSSRSTSCNSRTDDSWSHLADRYSELREARHVLVFPLVREIMRSTGVRDVLDFGCGDGRLLQEALEAGEMGSGVNYDPSEGMYRIACARAGGDARLRVVRDLAEVEPGKQEMVTSVAVWMCQSTEEACMKMLSEVRDLLRPEGHFLAAVTHPCFRWEEFSTFKTDFPITKYRESGTPFQVTLRDGEQELKITDTHWSLEDISRQLEESGFVIRRLHEVADRPEKGACPWLVVHAQLRPRGARGENGRA